MYLKRLRFYYGVLRGACARMAGRGEARTERIVRKEYGGNYAHKTNEEFMYKQAHVYRNGVPLTLRTIDYKTALLRRFADSINHASATSILELGCGRGFNLLSLAALCPRLRTLQGIELTAEGAAAARRNITLPPREILAQLTGLSWDTIHKRLASVSFAVAEGSIVALPFADNSFDVVFSNSVIEQIPCEYGRVFSESYRVARSLGIWSEPFAEAQGWNIFYRLYLKNIDYFSASYRAVMKLGWNYKSFTVPPLQKSHFNTGFLVCTKHL